MNHQGVFPIDDCRVIVVTHSDVCVLQRELHMFSRTRVTGENVEAYRSFQLVHKLSVAGLDSVTAADMQQAADSRTYLALGGRLGQVRVVDVTLNHRKEVILSTVVDWQAVSAAAPLHCLVVSQPAAMLEVWQMEVWMPPGLRCK
jgi:hypothetical protein